MSDFWELLKESVITQAAITILVVCATLYLWVRGLPVPPELYTLDSLVIGFYFGSKTGFYQGVAKGGTGSGTYSNIAAPSPMDIQSSGHSKFGK